MDTIETKSERIAVRVTPKQKTTLAQAAALRGRSLTDFIVDIAQREAERDLEKAQIVKLSIKGQQKLIDLLLDPPKPNEYLQSANKLYDETNIISR